MKFSYKPFLAPPVQDVTLEADPLLDARGLFVGLAAVDAIDWQIAIDTLDATTAPLDPADRLDVVRELLPTPAGRACGELARRVRWRFGVPS